MNMTNLTKTIGVVLLLGWWGSGLALAADAIEEAWGRAIRYLQKAQREDGSWGTTCYVGVTACVLEALTFTPDSVRKANEDFDAMAQRAAQYLASMQKEDGSIHDPGAPKNYSTSLTILALTKYDPIAYQPVIAKAVAYVKSLQCTEAKQYDPKQHVTYGGFGYGSTLRPDLSNTWFALNALKDAGVPQDDPVWKAARIFVLRCQNSTETNDKALEVGASDDPRALGGAMYLPGQSPAEEVLDRKGNRIFLSYGSMTYAMLLSFLWTGMKKEDLPVRLAVDWLAKNWSVDRNPNTREEGQQGLYYYYRVMAKSLAAYGERQFAGHDWAKELSAALLARQREDGSWFNEKDRWGEGDPALVTGYALTALAYCRDNLLDRK